MDSRGGFQEQVERCVKKSQSNWDSYFCKWETNAKEEAEIPEENLVVSDEDQLPVARPTARTKKCIKRKNTCQRKEIETVATNQLIRNADVKNCENTDAKFFTELLKIVKANAMNSNGQYSMLNIMCQMSFNIQPSRISMNVCNFSTVLRDPVPSIKRFQLPEQVVGLNRSFFPLENKKFNVLNKPLIPAIQYGTPKPRMCLPQTSWSDCRQAPSFKILSSDEESDDEIKPRNVKRRKLFMGVGSNSITALCTPVRAPPKLVFPCKQLMERVGEELMDETDCV